MSSYNSITKIKYNSDASDLVKLDEYIVFQDDKTKRKYIVFKFINNVTQQLLGMEFEVCQYNVDGDLIEKSLVVYNKFLAGAEEEFVPKAKLRVSYKCKTVSVRLIKAAFDRFIWKEGEYEDNGFKFEQFYNDESERGNEGGEKNKNARKQKPEKTEKPEKQTKKRKKKGKKRFVMKDASKKNFSKAPIVFNIIIFIVIIAFTVGSLLVFKSGGRYGSKKYTVDNFLVREVNKGEVAVYGYLGEESVVVIPATIGESKVTKIDGGAFKNSDITSVRINCSLTILSGAFVDCYKLESVYSEYSLELIDKAFENCTALKTVSLKNPPQLNNPFSTPFVNCGDFKFVTT